MKGPRQGAIHDPGSVQGSLFQNYQSQYRQMLLYHSRVPELTLKPPLNSPKCLSISTSISISTIHIYRSISIERPVGSLCLCGLLVGMAWSTNSKMPSAQPCVMKRSHFLGSSWNHCKGMQAFVVSYKFYQPKSKAVFKRRPVSGHPDAASTPNWGCQRQPSPA